MGKQTDTIIYSFTGLSSLQIGITGEVIKELIKDQVDLKIVKCDAVIQNCHFNHVHNCLACASCQTRTDFINSQLGIKAEQIIKLKKLDVKLDIPFFSSYKDLLKFEYKGIKIGRGAASSVISHYRDYSINSSNKKEAIEIELRKSALVLENMEEIIKKYSPKNFYIFKFL